MPLNFSAAHSSRITKKSQHKIPALKRWASSPLTNTTSCNQRKLLGRSPSKAEVAGEGGDDLDGECLDDVGTITSLASDRSLRDVAQIIQYVYSHMFEPMPENGGFNSTRIAEILNFRKSLPPTVTVAHVHALTPSPTTTEREIAELTTAGTIRRTVTPGRGTGGSSVGEGLILSRDLERLVKESAFLDKDLAEKFIACLRANPIAVGISRSSFTPSETRALMHSGFLTSITRDLHSTEAFSRPGAASSRTATSISSISRAASGSVAAVGGEDAIAGAGGRGGIRRSSSQLEKQPEQEWLEPFLQGEELKLSLPGTGPYLKLLTAARSHLVSLITKSKFREIPEYLLRERWDGGIAADDPAARAKKYRGEFKGILPSQSWKWKQFYGIAFDWVLAECLGAGSVEIFETRSVGRALRIP